MSTIVNGSPEPKFVLEKDGMPNVTIIVSGHTEYEGMYIPDMITHELQDGTIEAGELLFRFEPTVYFEKVSGDNLIKLAKVFNPKCYDRIYFYPYHIDKPLYREEVIITDEAVKLAYHYLLANKDFSVKLRGKKLVDSVPLAPADFTTWGNITLSFSELTMDFAELDDKLPCRLVATANVNLSSPPSTIDSVTIVAGDRILLTGQTDKKQNGIYIANTPPWTRAADSGMSAYVTNGMWCNITAGTLKANTRWQLTTADPIVLGTTELTFEETE
jgi:hypothetical protein